MYYDAGHEGHINYKARSFRSKNKKHIHIIRIYLCSLQTFIHHNYHDIQ